MNKIIFSKAISEAIKEHGTAVKFAKIIGIPSNYLSRWKNSATYNLKPTPEMWERLYPYISKYLPNNFDLNSLYNSKPLIETKSSKDVEKFLKEFAVLAKHNNIFTGIIQVQGIPIEKIKEAIRDTALSETQRKELIYRIFYKE